MTLTRVSIIKFHKKLLQWHPLIWNLELKLRNLSLQNWNFKFIDNEIFWFCDTILIFFCPFFNLGQNKAPVSLTLRHFQISLICIHVWSYEQIRWKKKKKKKKGRARWSSGGFTCEKEKGREKKEEEKEEEKEKNEENKPERPTILQLLLRNSGRKTGSKRKTKGN